MSFYNTLMNPRAESLLDSGGSTQVSSKSGSSREKSGQFLELLFSRLQEDSGLSFEFNDLSEDLNTSSPEYLTGNKEGLDLQLDEKINRTDKNEDNKGTVLEFFENRSNESNEEIQDKLETLEETVKKIKEKKQVDQEDLEKLRELVEKLKEEKKVDPEIINQFRKIFEQLLDIKELLKDKTLEEAEKLLEELEKLFELFQEQFEDLEQEIDEILAEKFENLLAELGVEEEEIKAILEEKEDQGFAEKLSKIVESLGDLQGILDEIKEVAGEDVKIEDILSGEKELEGAEELFEQIDKLQKFEEKLKELFSGSEGEKNGEELLEDLFKQKLAEFKELFEEIEFEKLDITEEELREKLEKLLENRENSTKGEDNETAKNENEEPEHPAENKENAETAETEETEVDTESGETEENTETEKSDIETVENEEEDSSGSRDEKSDKNSSREIDSKESPQRTDRTNQPGAEEVKQAKQTRAGGEEEIPEIDIDELREPVETENISEQLLEEGQVEVKGESVSVEKIVELFGEEIEIEIADDPEEMAEAGEKNSNEQAKNELLAEDSGRENTLGRQNEKLASYEVNSARSAGEDNSGENSFNSGSNQDTNHFQDQSSEAGEVQQSYISKEKMMETQQLIDQITEKTKMMLDKNKQTMRIKLKPEVLGELKLEIEVEDNEVSASFYVEKEPVRQSLDSNMRQLQEALQQLNIDVNELDVKVLDDETGGKTDEWFDGDLSENKGPDSSPENRKAEEKNSEVSTDASVSRVQLLENSTIEMIA